MVCYEPETGDENRGGRLIILYRVSCKRFLQVAYARIA